MFLIASKLSESAVATDTIRQIIDDGVRRAYTYNSDAHNKVSRLVWWGRPFATENSVFRATLFSSETD